MPYRRLPNTNQARLRAIKQAVNRAQNADYTEQVLSYKTLNEAQRFLMQFEGQMSQYNDNVSSRVNANRTYRRVAQNARMYISHFVQVLNMCVQRGEIKREQKSLYGLDPDINSVPELTSDEDILLWGKRIIDGEMKRLSMGGFPIYNPAINKVQVHYDIFKEHQQTHTFHERNTNRVYEDLDALRKQADPLILEIWNQVEEHFAHLLPYAKMQRCKQYGVIYYYRPDEKELTAETDRELEKANAMQTSLVWND